MVKNADECDIPIIEEILLDAVNWMSAVKRAFAGQGFSKELIDYAKKIALRYGIAAIRLNCNQHRHKLRAIYENEGFMCVKEMDFLKNHETALNVCNV